MATHYVEEIKFNQTINQLMAESTLIQQNTSIMNLRFIKKEHANKWDLHSVLNYIDKSSHSHSSAQINLLKLGEFNETREENENSVRFQIGK